jgi:hypothetical protein
MTSCHAAMEVAMAECMEGLGLLLTGTTRGTMGEGGGAMKGKRGGGTQRQSWWHCGAASCRAATEAAVAEFLVHRGSGTIIDRDKDIRGLVFAG